MAEDPEILRRLGTTLRGKWTLKSVLGVGGMAAVYVGVHKIGREDAIKILHPDVARSKQVRARFEQEAHAVNRFRHPGVVEIRDIDTAEDGAPFLVMELLTGESLSARAKRDGGVPQAEVLRIVDELLDVLAAAHEQGIIHRDIKPDNLFLMSDGRLKVLDFGIARMREGAPKTMHTRVGSTLGTIAYMPPEQTMSSKIDERADLFSAGATMFRLLAKRYIHEAGSEAELLVKMACEPAPPLASVAPDVPEGVCLVVDRALAFEKARRYPDARTMQADIRAVRSGAMPPYATERLRTDGPPSQMPAGAVPVSAPGSGEGLRESATVVPGKGAAAGAPMSGPSGPSPMSGPSGPSPISGPSGPSPISGPSPTSGLGARAAAGPATAYGLSDERLGMTNTVFSVSNPPPYVPPSAVRVLSGQEGAASTPPSAASASSPPSAAASQPPVASTPPPGRARMPSGAQYTPMLARASSSPRKSLPDTALDAFAAVRKKIDGLLDRLPADKRKPALIAAAAALALLFTLVLVLALRGPDDERPADDAADSAAADPSGRPSAGKPGDGEEQPPPSNPRDKGKPPRKKKFTF